MLRRGGRRAPRPRVPPPTADSATRAVTGNLGGWYRGLDGPGGPGAASRRDALARRLVPARRHDLARCSIDDGRWYAERPAHTGAYQDGYLFGYGDDYAAALADLRNLTGPGAAAAAQRVRQLVLALPGLQRAATTRSCSRASARAACRSTCWSSTPTARRRTTGTAGTGRRTTSRTRPVPRLGASAGPRRDPQRAPVDQHRRPELTRRRTRRPGGLIDGGDAAGAFMHEPGRRAAASGTGRHRDHVASYFSLHAPFEARRGRQLVARLLLRREPRERRRA